MNWLRLRARTLRHRVAVRVADRWVEQRRRRHAAILTAYQHHLEQIRRKGPQ